MSPFPRVCALGYIIARLRRCPEAIFLAYPSPGLRAWATLFRAFGALGANPNCVLTDVISSTLCTPLTRPRSSGTLSREGRGLLLEGTMGIESLTLSPRGRGWPAAGAFTSRGGPGKGFVRGLFSPVTPVCPAAGPQAREQRNRTACTASAALPCKFLDSPPAAE